MSNNSIIRNFQKKSIKENLANYKKERSNFNEEKVSFNKEKIMLIKQTDGWSKDLFRKMSNHDNLLNKINSKKKTQLNRNKTNDKYREIQVDYF